MLFVAAFDPLPLCIAAATAAGATGMRMAFTLGTFYFLCSPLLKAARPVG
eukprot:evm.model.NODE_1652_length_22004_cov_31.522722.2